MLPKLFKFWGLPLNQIGLPQIWFSAGLKILMLTLYILGCNEYQLDP